MNGKPPVARLILRTCTLTTGTTSSNKYMNMLISKSETFKYRFLLYIINVTFDEQILANDWWNMLDPIPKPNTATHVAITR